MYETRIWWRSGGYGGVIARSSDKAECIAAAERTLACGYNDPAKHEVHILHYTEPRVVAWMSGRLRCLKCNRPADTAQADTGTDREYLAATSEDLE